MAGREPEGADLADDHGAPADGIAGDHPDASRGGRLMLDTAPRRGHDGINWHARALVQKYTDRQVDWARRASGVAEPPARCCNGTAASRGTATRRLTATCW